MIRTIRGKEGFLGLLEILLALIIIAIIYIFIVKLYLKKPVQNEEIQKSLSEENIETSSPQGIVDSARKKVDALNKKRLEQYKQFDELEKGH